MFCEMNVNSTNLVYCSLIAIKTGKYLFTLIKLNFKFMSMNCNYFCHLLNKWCKTASQVRSRDLIKRITVFSETPSKTWNVIKISKKDKYGSIFFLFFPKKALGYTFSFFFFFTVPDFLFKGVRTFDSVEIFPSPSPLNNWNIWRGFKR